jgi:hypothetical protein
MGDRMQWRQQQMERQAKSNLRAHEQQAKVEQQQAVVRRADESKRKAEAVRLRQAQQLRQAEQDRVTQEQHSFSLEQRLSRPQKRQQAHVPHYNRAGSEHSVDNYRQPLSDYVNVEGAGAGGGMRPAAENDEEDEEVGDSGEAATYIPYTTAELHHGATCEHPDPVTEAASLSSVPNPSPNYKLAAVVEVNSAEIMLVDALCP